MKRWMVQGPLMMAFSDSDYQAGLGAVNDATTRLGTDIGKLGDVTAAVAARVAALATTLGSGPSAQDVKDAAVQLQAHAATLNGVSDAMDTAEATLNGIAADPATPVPPATPIVVPPAPTS